MMTSWDLLMFCLHSLNQSELDIVTWNLVVVKKLHNTFVVMTMILSVQILALIAP